jgi:hypothetical protein
VNGEINCLDPGGFGTVTIIKSITIDCRDAFGGIGHSGSNGINIHFDSFWEVDTRKTVRLRNLSLNSAGGGVIGIRITGGSTITGGVVFIEDCAIDGNFSGLAAGIADERTGGGELNISNTTVRNVGKTGIMISPALGAAAGQVMAAVLDNVRVQNAHNGIMIVNNAAVVINRSVVTGNTQAGIAVAGPLTSANVNVSNSIVSSNNGFGIQVIIGTATIRLSNNEIAFNGTAIGGATQSFGNNRISGNGAVGTAPTPIGTTSNPTGMQ